MRALKRLVRLIAFIALSSLGTAILMYSAPGYFSDDREMDASHALSATTELNQMRRSEASLPLLLRGQCSRWLHGDLGQSRQFNVPVKDLLRDRAMRSARLLLTGVACGWFGALGLAAAATLFGNRRVDLLATGFTSALLALPVGALATLCLLRNLNAPELVLATVIGVRDFKILHRMLQLSWTAPFILQARAHGLPSRSIFAAHLLPHLRHELFHVAIVSFTVALSALVPVEVIFDLPGLGQLAWSAAMNRDLPVLIAVTALMAFCLGLATLPTQGGRSTGDIPCV